jgi:hypothetical protein
MAIAKAEAIIQSNLRSEDINLSELGLESIQPLLPSLARVTRLRKLNLSHNRITTLPEDLSDIQNCQIFDLAGNPVSGLHGVIRGLLCLRQLKHLYIDLPYEADEDEIIVTLPTLESFNGTSLTEAFDDNQSPASNNNTNQPSSNNNNNNQSQPAASVSNNANHPSFQEQPASAYSRGNNNQQTRAASGNQQQQGVHTRWEEGDMSQVRRLYQAANSVSGRVVNRAEFDDYTSNVLGHLQTLLNGEDDPFRREGEILKAKRIMFEYCFDEIARSSHRFDANLSNVLNVLQESYTGLVENYDRLLKNLADDRDKKVDNMKADIQNSLREIETLMGQLDSKGGAGGGDLKKAREQWENERRDLQDRLGSLRAENEKLELRVRQAELGRNTSINPGSVRSGQFASGSPNRLAGAGGAATTGAAAAATNMKTLTLRQLRDVIEDIYASKSKFDIKCSETKLPRETMEQHMYTFLNQRYGLKHLILEWATAIVQGIKRYAADDNDIAVFGKILRNEIDEEFRFVQRQLKETVHELLRVYLKGKHPLKGDDDVNAMLRKRVNGTVSEDEWIDIVKYMYNTEDSVSIIMRIRDILKQRAAVPRRQGTARRTQIKEEVPLLQYSELLRILLDFQLEGHERFLSKFVRIFKQFDTDRNGVVNEVEFRSILKAVDPSKHDEEVLSLLELIDPNNNQLITFSECVTFLSSELVKMAREDNQGR